VCGVAERRRALGALLAVAALALTGCGGAADDPPVSVVSSDNGGYHGTHLDDPYVVPDVTLSDDDGAPYSLAKDPAPLKVVFFGYTNCPDICQAVMSTIASAVTRLDADQRKQVQVVFVTTDPARDTGPALRSYLARFDPDFTGVTGDLQQIIALGDPLKVYVDKGQKLPSGGYEVDHSTYVFGVTGDRAQTVWTQGTSPAAMAADIIKLLKS
jgi:protein SCO1/2